MKIMFSTFLLSFFLSSAYITGVKKNYRNIASTNVPVITNELSLERFLSIVKNPNIKTSSSLIHISGADTSYVQRVFGVLLQESSSHSRAQLYYPADQIFKNYYTHMFTLMLLAEFQSDLIHASYMNSTEDCSIVNNIFDPLNAIDEPAKYYSSMRDDYIKQLELADELVKTKLKKLIESVDQKIKLELNIKNELTSVIELSHSIKNTDVHHCNKLGKSELLRLHFSSDFKGVGMFMLNTSKHKEFFATNNILDPIAQIEYVSQFLVLNMSDSYSPNLSCLESFENKEQAFVFKKIVHAWQLLNGHPLDENRCDHVKLEKLRESFERILGDDNQFTSLFHRYLPLDSVEQKAFQELVKNIKYGENNNQNIDHVLNLNYSEERLSTNGSDILMLIEDEEEVRVVLPDDSASNIVIDSTPSFHDDSNFVNAQKRFEYVVIGKNTNIRSSPLILTDNYCGNTRYAQSQPFTIEVKKFISTEGFYKVDAKSLDTTIQVESCKSKSHLYIYKDFVKKIEEGLEFKSGRLNSWVTLRDRPGIESSKIIGSLGPGDIVITDRVLKYNKYLWIEILDVNGDFAWLYAGVIGNSKVEFLK